MIEFLNEAVRTAFHSLPIAEQMKWIELSKFYIRSGFVITMCDVQKWSEKQSEFAIRLDKKFNFDSAS